MRHFSTRWMRRAVCIALVLAACGLVPALRADAGGDDGDVSNLRGERKQALVEIGRRFFFDPVVSRSGDRSCASCHDPEHGFSDPARRSEDDAGITVRHAQTLLDSALNPSAHWDGEFISIERLVTARIGLPGAGGSGGGYGGRNLAPLRAGHSSIPFDEDLDAPIDPGGKLVAELGKLPRAQDVLEESGRYAAAAKAVWGDMKITRPRIARAIGAYCRTIESTEAPYDQYVAGNTRALTPAAVRGKALFDGRAGCAQCHLTTTKLEKRHATTRLTKPVMRRAKRATFTDFDFHNTGIAWDDVHETRIRRQVAEELDPKQRKGKRLEEATAAAKDKLGDPGNHRISTNPRLRRAFKTPTLRDLTRRGPYMHNGVFTNLHDVVRHYVKGGSDDPLQDERIVKLPLSEGEIDDLVMFLESLTGHDRPGLAQAPCKWRPETTTLRFLDGAGKPMVGLTVKLNPGGDRLPMEKAATKAVELITDEKGRIEFAPLAYTHVQMQLPNDIEPTQGPLVPDLCKKADITVPVSGRIELIAVYPNDQKPPQTLVAEHKGTFVLPGHHAPRTRLALKRVLAAGNVRIATYEGWKRTDVTSTVKLLLPSAKKPIEVDLATKGGARIDVR